LLSHAWDAKHSSFLDPSLTVINEKGNKLFFLLETLAIRGNHGRGTHRQVRAILTNKSVKIKYQKGYFFFPVKKKK
jgi:hypothetical protein